MANKWNAADLEKISIAFSQNLIKEYTTKTTNFTGDEIGKISNNDQINFFVLREIFGKWNHEAAKLQSPYFDFLAPEVVAAFKKFKNKLSENISVPKNLLENIVSKATSQTLNLYSDPTTFFKELLLETADGKVSQEWVDENSIFFTTYEDFFWELKKHLGEIGRSISVTEAVTKVESWLKVKDYSGEIDKIARLAGIEPPKAEVIQDEEASFFETFVKRMGKNDGTITREEVPAFDKIHSVFVKPMEEPISAPQEFTETFAPRVPVQVAPEPQIVIQPTARVVEPVTTKVQSVFDGFNIPTLNDSLQANHGGNSLSDMQSRSKIDSVKDSLTLNQRFFFLNVLFGGDKEVFDKALAEADSAYSFSDAKSRLTANYGSQFRWQDKTEDTDELFSLIQRRFI